MWFKHLFCDEKLNKPSLLDIWLALISDYTSKGAMFIMVGTLEQRKFTYEPLQPALHVYYK